MCKQTVYIYVNLTIKLVKPVPPFYGWGRARPSMYAHAAIISAESLAYQ